MACNYHAVVSPCTARRCHTQLALDSRARKSQSASIQGVKPVRQAHAAEVDDLITRLAAWFDVPRQRVATAVHQSLDGHDLDAIRHYGALVHGDTREQRLTSLRRILDADPDSWQHAAE